MEYHYLSVSVLWMLILQSVFWGLILINWLIFLLTMRPIFLLYCKTDDFWMDTVLLSVYFFIPMIVLSFVIGQHYFKIVWDLPVLFLSFVKLDQTEFSLIFPPYWGKSLLNVCAVPVNDEVFPFWVCGSRDYTWLGVSTEGCFPPLIWDGCSLGLRWLPHRRHQSVFSWKFAEDALRVSVLCSFLRILTCQQ